MKKRCAGEQKRLIVMAGSDLTLRIQRNLLFLKEKPDFHPVLFEAGSMRWQVYSIK
jgi:hypothetical protein